MDRWCKPEMIEGVAEKLYREWWAPYPAPIEWGELVEEDQGHFRVVAEVALDHLAVVFRHRGDEHVRA
jgi:hypothetical protein